ncbi:MAG: hypothetical protein FJX75_02610 [Armatimonadetes bacterium]|nr:hypothetical protein [Armatimonadota bacterium]
MRWPIFLLSILLPCACPASRVAKRVVRADAAGANERLLNRGFETPGDAANPAQAWGFWDRGYQVERTVVRTGQAAARCTSDDAAIQQGAAQSAVLSQTEPTPVVASGWSKAESVSGSPNADYSVYVDIDFTDGDHLWGQVSPFDTGTHDWQFRQVIIVPEKPIERLTVYGLFRGHTGTAYFDDFSLSELALAGGAGLFDGVPTTDGDPPLGLTDAEAVAAPDLRLRVDRTTGGVAVGERAGGFLLRDVAAESDFLQPTEAKVTRDGETVRLQAACPELKLDLSASLRAQGDAVRIDGEVRDGTAADRAVAVYVVLPADSVGGEFGRDMRTAVPIDKPGTYADTVTIGVGTNGRMSRYPLAPVVRGNEALCVATPLDMPRVSRLAYDARSRELYAAFDLGLSPDTRKFPSSATFSLLLYRFDPAWGFRAALRRYYDLFPEYFVKRIEREGIWMPFTDIATVPDAADFGFQFKEGDDNVPWDEAHNIDSFVYTEPMSHWLPLAKDVPRTYDAALAELKRLAATDPQSQATLNSAYTNADGSLHLWVLNAPWCDGALITGNPDPDLFADRPDLATQAEVKFAAIEQAFARAGRTDTTAWRDFGAGFETVADTAHAGARSVRCTNAAGELHGASQLILLNQTEPRDFTARAWSRAEGVTGEPDNSYALYLDLVLADGTPSYGHVAPFAVGTHDWEQAEVVVHIDKPVRSAVVHLLFRNQHSGTVWFDDVSLVESGSDKNLVADPGFEPPPEPPKPCELDGTYIDSYEMAGTEQNYRREHWAYTDLPLTFALTTRQVCSLGIFHTYEFERELAERMHSRGKLLFANAVLSSFAFPAHLLDVLGIETDWAPGGKYTPNSDEIMNFRRALCYQKPYLLLLNTNYNAFEPAWVERYFRRCAFYAIFPSFFSHNAADDPYWQNAALYNRDRPLFKRYIPVISTLNAAGWQPVTHARVSGGEGKVYVERFGSDPEAGLYLTLFNDSDAERQYSLEIDAKALGLAAASGTDVLADKPLSFSREENALSLEGTLQAEDVRVIKL